MRVGMIVSGIIYFYKEYPAKNARLSGHNPLFQPVSVVVRDYMLVADDEAEFIPQPLGDVLPNPLISASSGPWPCL